tara:strand:- start:9 stop:335 length:327 start_codon:yes stop_codon:yes gene_type:complete
MKKSTWLEKVEKMGKATASTKVKAPRGELYTQHKLIKGMHLYWQPKIGKTYKVQQNDRKWVLAKLINVCDKGMKPHYDAHDLEFHDAHAGKIDWVDFATWPYYNRRSG